MIVLICSFNYPLQAASLSTAAEKSILLGKRIYQQGIGENGTDITATGSGNIKINGELATCMSCHRRSGFGSSEGGLLIPSITGNSLFTARDFFHRELTKNKNRPIARKAYNQISLNRAIVNGIDANERPLNSIMPRYNFSKSELHHLSNYLKTLGNIQQASVDDETIHFATIITPDVPANRKSAMLAVLNTFINSKNANTRLEQKRSQKSPWHKEWSYQSYRKWKLHVWQLKGKPETWSHQLNKLYQSQPVFSVISGISDSSWQPVHRFCNSKQLPCLFPSSQLPGVSKNNNYSIYFTKGITLEAKTIAQHISKSINKNEDPHIVQILNNSTTNKVAADTLSSQLARYGINNTQEISSDNGELIKKTLEAISSNKKNQAYLVIWDLKANAAPIIFNKKNVLNGVYLTHKLALSLPNDHYNSTTPLYISYPFSLPNDMKKHLKRIDLWTKINHVEPVVNEITANTYFAVTLMSKGIKHLRNNFSQDYLIELIEHMVDTSAFHSVYPHLSLGPDQRYASKGSYILGPIDDINNPDIYKTATWLVP